VTSKTASPQKRDNSFLIIGIIVAIAVVALVLLVFTGGAPPTVSEVTRQTNAQFLTSNGQREGVTTTPSGLQYEVITEGDGTVSPVATDTVTVNYVGTLLDGTQFDSSYDRGQPATFSLNQVISGWTEGLQLMTVGDRFRFWVPPELGYGSQANGPIPANAVLVFEVELLGINGDPQ
jgi:peptidylprolyl isomerase